MHDAHREIDFEAFARDIASLRGQIDAQIGPDDLRHLRKMESWGRTAAGLGYATAWLVPNPLSAVLISLGNTARWTIVAHHVSHRAFDKVPGVPDRYTSKHFAMGPRRALDWLDWILPEAWHHEHDILHHYHTSELADPDLVEENAERIRGARVPTVAKYAVAGFYACTWKLTYYAPSTFQTLKRAEQRRTRPKGSAPGEDARADARGRESYAAVFNPLTAEGREFWRRCVLPYGAARFGLLPLLFAPLGPWAVFSVLANSVGAEVLTNLHTFAIIAPNHAGDDIHRFDGPLADRAEFFVRQAAGSANYLGGTDVTDFLQGWLNYQIEHHLFPDLPPLKYRQYAARVRAICEKHGVPYVQESVFRRVGKLLDVLVGKASMRTTPLRRKRHAVASAGSAEAAPA